MLGYSNILDFDKFSENYSVKNTNELLKSIISTYI